MDSSTTRSLTRRNRFSDILAIALLGATAVALLGAAVARARIDVTSSAAAAGVGLVALALATWRAFELRTSWNDQSTAAMIGKNDITIYEGAVLDRGALRALGGRRSVVSPRLWTVPFSDRADLGRLLGRLRDLGLAFVTDPHGWGPAEVFEQLREQRLAHGQYRRADEYPWNLR